MGAPIDGLSGLSAMMYGACCGAFCKSYRKPGIWLLGLGFSAIAIPCYVLLAWLGLAVATKLSWWAIDLFVGTAMFGPTAKLLLSVIVYNRRMSRYASKIKD